MSENRYFQWIISEKIGQINIFDKIESEDGIIYIVFKDGSRINESLVAQLNEKDLTNKMMAEIDSPNNIWQFKEEWVGRQEERWEMDADSVKQCVQPFIPGRKVVHLIPPKPTAARSSSFGTISNTEFQYTPPPPLSSSIELKTLIDKTDPVYILMSRARKIDTEITMSMVISLPPKTLYNISKESFDEGADKFTNYIIDEIGVEEIKDALKTAIKDMYENID